MSSGSSNKPPRIFIYGPNGVGKSSLAADYGDAIVIDCEAGTDKIKIDRYLFDDHGRSRPQSLAEVYYALRHLYATEHKYRAVILDGLDELERLIWESMYKDQTKKDGSPYTSIEDFGYGKGFTMAIEEWRRLASSLEHLRERRKMAAVLVGHSQVTPFRNPLGDDFDRFTPLLHKGASSFLLGWADWVGFMDFEVSEGKAKDKGGNDKVIGAATGARVLHLDREAGFDAKGRGDHPKYVIVPRETPFEPLRAVIAGDPT